MKKLLGIVVLGFFISTNLFAVTQTELFVFNKLYKEYSECTVYYKFIARGVERRGDLTEDQKKFMDKAISLSEEAEKNMFFFAQELKISNDDVQSNVEKIYKSFLEKVDYNYSNSEILVDYAKKCINSISDPKIRMIYWENIHNKELEEEKIIKFSALTLCVLLILIIIFIFRKKNKQISPQKNFSKKILKEVKKNKQGSKVKLAHQKKVKNETFDKMNENSKLAGKLNSIMLDVLRHQLSITVKGLDHISKNKDPLMTLPKNNFVYGYLYGFADYCYQTSGKISDEESWLIGSLAFFSMIFGPDLGAKICMNSEKLLNTNKEFNDGVKSGSNDARDWKNKKGITGLSDYINNF